MDNIEIYIRGKHHAFKGPANWNEVSGKQALQLMRLVEQSRTKPHAVMIIFRLLFDIPEDIASWLFDAAHIRRCEPYISEEDLETCLEQGLALINHVAWVHDSPPPSNWLIKEVSQGLIKSPYFGPGDDLESSTFEEFMFAEQYFDNFQRTKNVENVVKLMATLYRPGSKSNQAKFGDARFPFSAATIEAHARKMATSTEDFKAYVVFNYQGVRQMLALAFPHVFSTKTSENNEQSSDQNGTWLDVALGLAGENINNLDSIRRENLYVVLRYLENKIKNAQELEKRLKK